MNSTGAMTWKRKPFPLLFVSRQRAGWALDSHPMGKCPALMWSLDGWIIRGMPTFM